MRTTRLVDVGNGNWVCDCLFAVCISLGMAHCLLADDDHERDRDRHPRDRDTRFQVNVNIGGPAVPAPPSWIVDNRGPIHEAFAEPVAFDPTPGMVISKRPPALLHEVPPGQCPRGDDIRWIPGYWGWDDDRADFVWISGIWRNIPPGRQYVPGYWCEIQGRYQWISGFWQGDKVEVVQYLPMPPESHDLVTMGVPPQPDYIWIPGVWLWTSSGYTWRPGYWIAPRQDWVWVPDHYIWTPRGYVFVNGYWDYVIPQRGVLFAPVYLPPQGHSQSAFIYMPDVVVNVSLLIGKMFARPHYDHYYFGDYYDRSYFKSGIYPVVSYHNSRYGYDPNFAQYVAVQKTDHTIFTRNLRDEYHFRRDHPEARPPRTYTDLQRMAGRGGVNPHEAQYLTMAQPLSQAANRSDGPFRFQSLTSDRMNKFRQTVTQLQDYLEQRRNLETRRPEDKWKGTTVAPSGHSVGPWSAGSKERSGQPSPQAVQPTPSVTQHGPAQATESRLSRSPLGSRARNILEQIFKPTPTPPKASAPDRNIKPGSRPGIRREPQE